MNYVGGADTLTVINGPEDGTRYSLTRGPVVLGAGGSCQICLRLDNTVRPMHARLVADASGYRVRSASGSPVSVNGRRAGSLRSRVLQSGEVLRVGHTDLMLECAADGPAHRSRGIVTESDAAWILRKVAGITGSFLRWLTHTGSGMVRFVLKRWKLAVFIGLAGAWWYSPVFRATVLNVALRAAQQLQAFVQGIFA